MRILSLSDTKIPFIYSPVVRRRFAGVDLIVGCGDLPYYYLEYVYNALDVPLYYVRGNHDPVMEYGEAGQRTGPHGGLDLHRRVYHRNGLLIAGVEGSTRYKPGRFQYSQAEFWRHVLWLAPRLMLNRLRLGRDLDIFVSHAPAEGPHAGSDHAHRGVKAFEWLVRVFQPRLHLHGHVHLYTPNQPVETQIGATRVVNAYGYRELFL